jgi:hypothetical protein
VAAVAQRKGLGLIEHNGEVQLAMRRIADTRKQLEEEGDRDGLRQLLGTVIAQGQAISESWNRVVLRDHLDRKRGS